MVEVLTITVVSFILVLIGVPLFENWMAMRRRARFIAYVKRTSK
jgi:Tfp pilus assembly protein FimT